MPSDEKSLRVALAAHPGWMSAKFLQSATGLDQDKLIPLLERLVAAGLVTRSESDASYWQWANAAAADAELASLEADPRRDLHRKLYDFIRGQADLDGFAALLAYHAALGGLQEEAHLWNLRFGEIMSVAGNFDSAREYLQKALTFATDPAQQARVYYQTANLDFHLGRFSDAEAPYRRAMQFYEESRDETQWIRSAQSLAATQVEQGKYSNALDLLNRCRERLQKLDLPLEQAVITLHLTQVYIGMGMMREADASLKAVQALFGQSSFDSLAPYQQLLEGKLEVIQGRLAMAFRIFEEAAQGFQGQGDLAGKLEVLLSISAPLMEHSLIKEAQTLIDQVSSWEELKSFPALEHSVHLRRLALGVFSGKWVQDDLALLSQDASKIGRIEDWLQFWFHMSLAARRLKQNHSAETFLLKARSIVDEMAQRLKPEQRETFLRRPDIARIWRLTERDFAALAQSQRVRAKRNLLSSGPAEPATLAPPTPQEKGPSSEE